MEENDQQSTDIHDYVSPAKVTGERVVQPSASFVEEMKTAQPATPAPTQAPDLTTTTDPAQTQQTENTSVTPQASLKPSTPSSVYPEVTRGIGSETPAYTPVSQGEPLPGPKLVQKLPPKETAVKVVAGVIIILNTFNFYDWILELHAGYANWVSALEIFVILVLAVGIFRLSETARSIFVIISAISLILSCVGFILFYVSIHNLETTVHSPAVTRASLENNISSVENDKELSAQAKQEKIQQIQKEINNIPASHAGLQLKQYFSTAVLILTAIGPLVFFTRPSIKEVFK